MVALSAWECERVNLKLLDAEVEAGSITSSAKNVYFPSEIPLETISRDFG